MSLPSFGATRAVSTPPAGVHDPASKDKRLRRPNGRLAALRGRLARLTHVLYLSGRGGKCFLVLVDRGGAAGGGLAWLVVPVGLARFRFLQTSGASVLGSATLHVSNVIEVQFNEALSSRSTPIYRATSKSAVQLSTGPPLLPTTSALDCPHFSGVVTDASECRSGVAVLNRRVLLVATALCHVTNVRRLRAGQRVAVSGACMDELAEAVQYPLLRSPAKILSLCGGCRLFPVDESTNEGDGGRTSSVHCRSESEAFGRDSVVDLALEWNCGHAGVVYLLGLRRRAVQLLPEHEHAWLDAAGGLDGKNPLGVMAAQLLSPASLSSPERSLLRECLDLQHRECAAVNAAPPNQKRELYSVHDLSAWLENLLDRRRLEIEERRARWDDGTGRRQGDCLNWCQQEFGDDSPVVVGRLCASNRTGHLELTDSTGSISVCLPRENSDQKSNVGACAVDGFTAVKEWCRHPGDDCEEDSQLLWERTYVVPRRIIRLIGDDARGDEAQDRAKPTHEVRSFSLPFWPSPASSGARVRVVLVDDRGKVTRRTLPASPRLDPGWRVRCEGDKVMVVDRGSVKVDGCYALQELKDAIGDGEVFSVRAEVRERWFEKSKFRDDEGKMPKSEGNDGGSCKVGVLPRGMVLHLKLASDVDNHQGDLVSFYLSSGAAPLQLPLGVVRGARVELRDVRRVRSRRSGFAYLVPTADTDLILLGLRLPRVEEEGGVAGASAWLGLLEDSSSARWLRLTLERATRVSVTLLCRSCSNPLGRGGGCAFVGCHSQDVGDGDSFGVCCAANFRVADETAEAELVVQDERQLRQLLGFSPPEWSVLLRGCLESGRELLHLDGGREDDNHPSSSLDLAAAATWLLRARCRSLAETTRTSFDVLARPFRKDHQTAAATAVRRRLFCLGVAEGAGNTTQ